MGGHGACTDDGVCVCDPMWEGVACGIHTCPRCSGHGACKNDMCTCEPGWSGETCSCPTSLDGTHLPVHLATSSLRAVQNYNNVCSGHGKCVDSKCECQAKWTGRSFS